MSQDDRDDDPDRQLFEKHMRDVQPLKQSGRVVPEPSRPKPRAAQREADERNVLKELLEFPCDPAEMDTGEELNFLRPGLQKRYLTRLRRGHYSIRDHLDLHHMNVETARNAILEFIGESHDRELGCVRIVHGKGLRSKRGPVLKQLTARILSRHPQVAAFTSCRPVDGGTGAVAVLLRRHKSAEGK